MTWSHSPYYMTRLKKALTLKPFKKEDFPEYLSWFQDPDLNEQLGPMEKDDEWLTYAIDQQKGLTEYVGCTYSVFQNEKLVSIIGVDFPDPTNHRYGISSIAIKPNLRERGIGSKALQELINLHPLKSRQYWVAYVDEKNPKAKLFFEANGWTCTALPSSENNHMYVLEYHLPR